MSMDANQYATYVSEVVRQLDFCASATVHRNRKFPGKRQPGEYEVDIAIEVCFGDVAYCLFIIECKNWGRPVDRPVVQKLVQTRDAIAAHKAIVVSPVGFSREAILVAEANGVGLWVVCPGRFSIAMHHTEDLTELERLWRKSCQKLYEELRRDFLAAFRVTHPQCTRTVEIREMREHFSKPDPNGLPPFGAFVEAHFYAPPPYEPLPVFNPIIGELFHQICRHENWRQLGVVSALGLRFERSRQRLRSMGVDSEEDTQTALGHIAANSYFPFQDLLRRFKTSATEH